MNVKELLQQWKEGTLDLDTVAEGARSTLLARGFVNTRLLGWVKQAELQRLIDINAIVIDGDDFAFKTMWIDEYETKSRMNKKIPTGRKRRILTPEAEKCVCKQPDIAKDKYLDSVVDHYADEADVENTAMQVFQDIF